MQYPATPYRGGLKGTFWNSQALFAAKAHRQRAKQLYVQELCRDRDVVGLIETHGNEGATRAAILEAGFEGYWATGTNSRGGVGLLIADRLLANFDQNLTRWETLEEGRAAVAPFLPRARTFSCLVQKEPIRATVQRIPFLN